MGICGKGGEEAMNSYHLILCADRKDGYTSPHMNSSLGSKIFIVTLIDLRAVLRNKDAEFVISRTDKYRQCEWYEAAEELLGPLSELASCRPKLFFVYINGHILPCKEWSIECASSIDGKWPDNIPKSMCVLIDILRMDDSSLCLWGGNIRIEKQSLFINRPVLVDPEQK